MRCPHPYRWLALTGLTVLVSCASPPQGGPPPEAGVKVSGPAALPASQSLEVYQIDPIASTLHLLVYRGGPMAKLGHNHVISSRSMHGTIWHGDSLESSGFDLTVPVNALIVDDNAARAAEGADFPLNVSDDAKAGTKANMLREALLDGARYPDISIRSVSMQGDPDSPRVTAALRIKDQTRTVTLPVTTRFTASGLHVKGEFEIKQTDFGMTPVSVALGALQVLDTVKIKFELAAKAESPRP